MRRVLTIGFVLGIALCGAPFPGVVRAQDQAVDASARQEGIEESVPALSLDGKSGDGERAFEVCSHCHLPSAAGRPDGSVPQIAGQHTSVLIKQISDIRDRRRENPIMYPFARTLLSPQKLADVAAYVETLPIPRENGKGPGTLVELGRTLYERDCAGCHLDSGQGSAVEFTPVLAGQHYEYLLRQLRDVASGWRRNIHPDMTVSLSSYTPDQIVAVADYVSRLEWPERQQQN